MARILVVDDNPDVCKLVRLILEKRGYEVDVARSGNECFKKLSEAPIPDLILMDIMLPDEDGLKLVEKIKGDERTKRVPVYLFTVLADGKLRKPSGFMADGCILKPFRVDEFVDAVDSILKQRRT